MLKPPPRELFFSRGEPEDPRLGEIVRIVSKRDFAKRDWDVAIIGFPDDRGITLNKGRKGAAHAPREIRKWLYRLVPPRNDTKIADLGDLVISEDLAADHKRAVSEITFALMHSKKVLLFGGGHDWGFAPIAALLQTGGTGFINFDAHLDVRASSIPHSGTSFWRALENGVEGKNAIWFGIQSCATAKLHKDYAEAKGGTIFYGDSPSLEVEKFLESVQITMARCDCMDLSLDMDVFAMSEAPGVSAPQPSGVPSRIILALLRQILSFEKVRTFGIYELSPPHDLQDMTARLAARCAWEVLR
ncbi:MAG TPA: formimidoylglutamase [Fimbriimonadales bacterium]|nr:formimidoylglutamase [Fimbriimonadales bacterium]